MAQSKQRDQGVAERPARRVSKSDRRREILLELKLRPHVRNTEFANRFEVSPETVRRDLEALERDGLISRAHGGALAPAHGHYPGLSERENTLVEQRERIGRRAAEMLQDGETAMIDSGSTTVAVARALAYLGTRCTIITNSLPVAVALGQGPCRVLMCPGEYLPTESAVVGTETLEFLERFNVDHCVIGASGLCSDGPSEAVTGFAAVKRLMLRRAKSRHLVLGSEKFDRRSLSVVAPLEKLTTIVANRKPKGDLAAALQAAGVEVVVA